MNLPCGQQLITKPRTHLFDHPCYRNISSLSLPLSIPKHNHKGQNRRTSAQAGNVILFSKYGSINVDPGLLFPHTELCEWDRGCLTQGLDSNTLCMFRMTRELLLCMTSKMLVLGCVLTHTDCIRPCGSCNQKQTF